MGFNHCYISSVENLQSEFERKGLEEFVKSYRKHDAITGPSESFRFLEEKQKQYEEYINNIDNNSNTDKL